MFHICVTLIFVCRNICCWISTVNNSLNSSITLILLDQYHKLSMHNKHQRGLNVWVCVALFIVLCNVYSKWLKFCKDLAKSKTLEVFIVYVLAERVIMVREDNKIEAIKSIKRGIFNHKATVAGLSNSQTAVVASTSRGTALFFFSNSQCCMLVGSFMRWERCNKFGAECKSSKYQKDDWVFSVVHLTVWWFQM